MSVPDIATLRQRANTIISRAGSGQMRAMLAGICAAKNTGDPLPSDSTGQQLITECQQIIDQADSDALAIFVREFMEFVENAGDSMGCCDQVEEILNILRNGTAGPPVFEGPNPGTGSEAASYSGQIVVSGTFPMAYTLESGSIPTGTSLNGSTGLISGTASAAGTYTFTIRATNTEGTATQEFSIGINGRIPYFQYPVHGATLDETVQPDDWLGVQIGTDTIGQFGFPGWSGTFATFIPTGLYPSSSPGSVPITYSYTGLLPDGMSLDASTGVFTGTPSNAGQIGNTFTFNILGTNDYGVLVLKYKMQVFP